MTIWIIVVAFVVAFLVLRSLAPAGRGSDVVVKTVKGNRAAEREIARMRSLGYQLEGQSSRKVAYSLTTGVFTRKQKHTLTFIRPEEPRS